MNNRITGGNVREEVRKIVDPILIQEGMELVDVEYGMESGRWVLRVYIDKEGGVTLGDCAGVSRELNTILDVKGLISHRYSLEVSSPGLDRPLVKEADFIKNKGKKVKLKTTAGIENKRNFTGILEEVGIEDIILKGDQGELWKIPFANIKKARLKI
ncbi:MAG: ribosome maturation factor RimP [Thermodesulfobacteriota bacterium]